LIEKLKIEISEHNPKKEIKSAGYLIHKDTFATTSTIFWGSLAIFMLLSQLKAKHTASYAFPLYND